MLLTHVAANALACSGYDYHFPFLGECGGSRVDAWVFIAVCGLSELGGSDEEVNGQVREIHCDLWRAVGRQSMFLLKTDIK